MTGIWDQHKRSEVMRLIRSNRNKATELRLIEIFRKHQISGWRRLQKLFGHPDFVFRKASVCIFVDGCFWHGCARCYRRPKSNREYWDKKVERNKTRDRQVNCSLRKAGWRVLRIWQHELLPKSEATLIARIRKYV